MTNLEYIQKECQNAIDANDWLVDEWGNLEQTNLTELYAKAIIDNVRLIQDYRNLIDFYYGIENLHKRNKELTKLRD